MEAISLATALPEELIRTVCGYALLPSTYTLCFFDGVSEMGDVQRENWVRVVQTLAAHRATPIAPEAESLASPRGLLLPRFLLQSPSLQLPSGCVMPWHQDSMQDRLSKEHLLWPRRSLLWRLSLAEAVAEAVHALHQRHILHCDIKPENLLLLQPSDSVLAFQREPAVGLKNWSSSLLCDPDNNLVVPRDHRPRWCDSTPSHDFQEVSFLMGMDWRNDVHALALTLWQMILGLPWMAEDGRKPTDLLKRVNSAIEGAQFGGEAEAFFQPLKLSLCSGREHWMVSQVGAQVDQDRKTMAEHMRNSPVKHDSVFAVVEKSKLISSSFAEQQRRA